MTPVIADSCIVRRLQAGDDSAVADLARSYGARMYQLALRYTRNKEDAEEVVQDVLLKVRDKIDAFRGDAALSSWIYRITFNTSMSRLRNGRFSRPHDPAVAIPIEKRVATWRVDSPPSSAPTTRSRRSWLYGLPIDSSDLGRRIESRFKALGNPQRLSFQGKCSSRS